MRKTFVTSSLLLAILFCLSLVYVEATGKKPESPSVGQKLAAHGTSLCGSPSAV